MPAGPIEWLVVLSVVGTAFLRVSLPANLAPVDFLLGVVNVVGGLRLVRQGSPAARLFRQALPWLWLLALSCVIPLFEVGFAAWALNDAARDLMAIFTFFALLALLNDGPAAACKAALAFVGVASFVAVSVLTSSGLRSAGSTFDNPNYAGHFLAAGLIVIVFGRLRLSGKVRILVALLLGTAVVRTGSFSALLILAGAAAYWTWRHADRIRPYGRVVARVLVVSSLAVIAWMGATSILTSEFDAGAGLSSERFDRSSSTRLGLWADGLDQLPAHPLGLSPGGARARLPAGTELHSDPLAFLVENGVLGLVAIIAVVLTIWRHLPHGGLARILLVGFLVSSFFRETVNFRHLWVILAVSLALDWRQQRELATKLSLEGTRS